MKQVALRNGVQGWVRNRGDGAVEAIVQGDESNVEKVLEWATRGPPGARVSSLHREPLNEYQEQMGFRIVVPDWWEEEGEE